MAGPLKRNVIIITSIIRQQHQCLPTKSCTRTSREGFQFSAISRRTHIVSVFRCPYRRYQRSSRYVDCSLTTIVPISRQHPIIFWTRWHCYQILHLATRCMRHAVTLQVVLYLLHSSTLAIHTKYWEPHMEKRGMP